MIAPLIRASFRRPLLVILLALAAAAAGAASLLNLRRDVFPDLTTPVFNVIVQNVAMAPEELEQGVAIPLETALSGLPDVRRLRSSSQAGVTQVTIEFEPDADYYRARQLVSERVQQAAAELPAGTDAPLVSSLTGRLNEILEFTLESDTEATASPVRATQAVATQAISTQLAATQPVAAQPVAVQPVTAQLVAAQAAAAPPTAQADALTGASAAATTAESAATSTDGRTDLMALRDLAEFEISRRLRSVPGVATSSQTSPRRCST
jgi:Cu/Ag efflux pump CusA